MLDEKPFLPEVPSSLGGVIAPELVVIKLRPFDVESKDERSIPVMIVPLSLFPDCPHNSDQFSVGFREIWTGRPVHVVPAVIRFS